MVKEEDRMLFEILDSLQTANISLSIILNAFLIWIIMKSSKELHGYRYLLIVFAVNDIWFPIVHFLTAPNICSYRDAFIMFSNGIMTSKFSACFFGATFSQTMPIMAHLFVYRLISLRWPRFVSLYTSMNTTLLISCTLIIGGVIWFANCWFNYHSDEKMQLYVKPFLDEEFPGGGQGHIGTLYYDENGLRISAVLSTLTFNCIMTVWSTVIGVCSVLIVQFLKISDRKWSYQTQALQKQMFKTLVAQMIVPILFVYLPCAGIINCPMFWHFSVFPNLASAMVTLFPVADAVITLIMVKMFRKKTVSLVKGALRRVKGENQVAQSSLHHRTSGSHS